MDSLVANYASSDEEEEQHQQQHQEESDSPSKSTSKFSGDHSSPNFNNLTKTSSILSSLPQPKSSSSLFLSLPPPKSHLPTPQTLTNLSPSHPKNHEQQQEEEDQFKEESNSASKFSGTAKPKSSSVFSFLPPPKSQHSNPQTLPSNPNPKRVVQFKPPINLSLIKPLDDDEDEEDKEKEGKRHKEFESSVQTSSVKSFLSSIPAPKNSGAVLGAVPSSGSGRRSIVETDISTSNSDGFRAESEPGIDPNVGNYESNLVDGSSVESVISGSDASNWAPIGQNYENYDNYEGYSNYGYYESNWVNGSTAMPTAAAEMSGMGESVVRVPGKRGRNEVPMEVVEVKQDELIKNRPREDQVKLTGIAFGPSYQPVSTKGKPSKLHKRKHQIGSLFFDMKQKEMELSERRSRGFLTKAETQAKYGW